MFLAGSISQILQGADAKDNNATSCVWLDNDPPDLVQHAGLTPSHSQIPSSSVPYYTYLAIKERYVMTLGSMCGLPWYLEPLGLLALVDHGRPSPGWPGVTWCGLDCSWASGRGHFCEPGPEVL